MMTEEPLTHEEFGLIYAAGWRNIGASREYAARAALGAALEALGATR